MTHPDTAAVAEFRAGLITGRRGAAIAAHLADCERCAAVDGGLTEVSTLLAAVPAPAMPDSAAHRLNAAIAAEAAHRDHPERAGRDSMPEPSAPGRPRAASHGFRLLRLRVLAPAAAVVVLAAGGYGLSQIGRGPGSQTPVAGNATAASPSGALPTATGKGTSARPELAPAAYLPVETSAHDFTAAGLGQQLETVLRTPRPALQAASPQIRGCAQNVAGHQTPVRVVQARYEGRPATIVVTREGSGYLARVEGPRCSATSRDPLATAMLPPGI